ncbi:MAG: sulfatase-like hydrolase/transferase [Thermoguttaceae bacterium]
MKISLFLQTAILFAVAFQTLATFAADTNAPIPFKGVIKLDVRDSTPDWTPYLPKKAPKDSPNVLFILYDDTGMASWSSYGGRIQMPTLDRLAANGITYTQWHTTALCSPTRACLLTGRNHHLAGMASVTETTLGFPGHNGRIPDSCATIGQVLQDNGWSTFWLGKNHNVPIPDVAPGASRKQWPLQKGFDRFYGFFGGETNQWYPDLIEDNRFIDQPYTPEQGYHLSKDIADQAIRMIKDQQSSNPSRPWFMFYCPGANHAPHQCPQEYIDKYKGKFDDGYEAYREWVLPRMVAKGILPRDTALTPINPMPKEFALLQDSVRPWNSLNADEKKLFSRMAEVFAGFSEYTDAQIGRLIDYLEKTGQLDNTIVFYASDNGASGEGSPNGSVNENKFFNGYPDDLAENVRAIDILGGPDSYGHYPTGWAVAFSTPFQMFKRYSQYSGGTCDPLVVSWPKGIKSRGEMRNQYHHATDIVPTILDVCGVEMPDVFHGIEQTPLSGVSMRYSFDAESDAPTQKKRQYYSMFGTRGIWEDGWKAVAVHAPMPSDKGNFDEDRWQLYHVDVDRSESKDLAADHPEKLQSLIRAWFEEADKNNVLPLDDRGIAALLRESRPLDEPRRDRAIYYPDTVQLRDNVIVSIRGRSYKILASVDIKDSDCSGVLFEQGSRFGGHSLFIKDGRLHYVYNFLGIKPEQHYVSSEKIKLGKQTLGMEFVLEKRGDNSESLGTMRLYVDDRIVAEGAMQTQPGSFGLDSVMRIGRASSDPVSKEYSARENFAGGEIQGVCISAEKLEYQDLERDAQRLLKQD